MYLRQLLYEETAWASYLLGCKTHRKLAVFEPHVDLVDEYRALAGTQGAPIVAVFARRGSGACPFAKETSVFEQRRQRSPQAELAGPCQRVARSPVLVNVALLEAADTRRIAMVGREGGERRVSRQRGGHVYGAQSRPRDFAGW